MPAMAFELVQITCALRPHATSCNDEYVFPPGPAAGALFTFSVTLYDHTLTWMLRLSLFCPETLSHASQEPNLAVSLAASLDFLGCISMNTQLALPANIIDRTQRIVAPLSAWLRADSSCLQSNAR